MGYIGRFLSGGLREATGETKREPGEVTDKGHGDRSGEEESVLS